MNCIFYLLLIFVRGGSIGLSFVCGGGFLNEQPCYVLLLFVQMRSCPNDGCVHG